MNTVYQFAKEAVVQIKSYLPTEYQDVVYKDIIKEGNNGVCFTKLSFAKPEQKISTEIDLNPFFDFYQQTGSMESAMEKLTSAVTECIDIAWKNPVDVNCFESVKDCLGPALINTGANLKMLQDIPHMKIEDLSLICQIRMPAGKDYVRINVTDRNLKQWEIGKVQLFKHMIENTRKPGKWLLQEMNACINESVGMGMKPINLLELTDDSLQERGTDSVKMYVLSNMDKKNGAAAIVCPHVMEKVEKIIPEGFYILPSSIHECIILSKRDGFDLEQLRDMVLEINETVLESEDILSHNVYEYDKEHGKIRQASSREERGKEMER